MEIKVIELSPAGGAVGAIFDDGDKPVPPELGGLVGDEGGGGGWDGDGSDGGELGGELTLTVTLLVTVPPGPVAVNV